MSSYDQRNVSCLSTDLKFEHFQQYEGQYLIQNAPSSARSKAKPIAVPIVSVRKTENVSQYKSKSEPRSEIYGLQNKDELLFFDPRLTLTDRLRDCFSRVQKERVKTDNFNSSMISQK